MRTPSRRRSLGFLQRPRLWRHSPWGFVFSIGRAWPFLGFRGGVLECEPRGDSKFIGAGRPRGGLTGGGPLYLSWGTFASDGCRGLASRIGEGFSMERTRLGILGNRSKPDPSPSTRFQFRPETEGEQSRSQRRNLAGGGVVQNHRVAVSFEPPREHQGTRIARQPHRFRRGGDQRRVAGRWIAEWTPRKPRWICRSEGKRRGVSRGLIG